jgi:GNAT acetyltransferase-like protein
VTRVARAGQAASRAGAGEPGQWELRWNGRTARVTTPVPAEIWAAVAASDPTTLPFQTPAWRDCVSASSGWQDASRLYETAGGRQLVLMMARRRVAPGLAVAASWPAGWGSGGVLARGGLRPEDADLVCADLASGRAVSVKVRPGFAAAAAWSQWAGEVFTIPRAVHVAHFTGTFDEFWAGSVAAKSRSNVRNAWRHIERAGIVITNGNSPELVRGFYGVYLRWIDWRARQRKVPGFLARRQGQRAEPYRKFAAVAGALGEGCRIWVAWQERRPVAATISLYAGDAAVSWRAYADRSVPARLRLADVLLVEALRYACESGCRYVELGESGGRADLVEVKTRFGGQEHRFAEYCFERVPLTPGRLALQRLGHHAEDWITSRRGTVGPRAPQGPAQPGGTR